MRVRPNEAEALEALAHGRNDLSAFSREVLGIEPNPAQARLYRYISPGTDGWTFRYKVVIHVAANQIGKTVAIAILILWACTYKVGVEPPDERNTKSLVDWQSRPYQWFHLAPSQQQAYLTLDDIVLLVQGAHYAQEIGKGFGLKCRWLPGLVSEVKVEQYYRGLTFWNGAVCQFRTTENEAKALQGRRASGISFDEAALENNLKWIVNTVLMMRLVATNGPLFLVGTPNGINDYYEFVTEITQHLEEQPWTQPTEENPEERVWIRGHGVVCWSHVDDNIGFGLTKEAVDLLETGGLDENTREQQLRGAFLEPAEAFFTPMAPILAAFRKSWNGKPVETLVGPQVGHRYVIFWDPSVASDPTAAVVLDITTEPWVGVALKHHRKPLGINELIQQIWATHLLYNSREDEKRMKPKSVALTGYDATSMGGQIVKQMLAGLYPSKAVNFGGPSAKIKMLTNLRAALSKGKLILPDDWSQARREVASYRLKDDKIPQDIVMALAGAVDIASLGFSGEISRPFAVQGRVSVTPVWR